MVKSRERTSPLYPYPLKQSLQLLSEVVTICVPKKSIVSNARCLTEGVDVKVIDSVYFVDPKYKLIDIVQATGRAVRLHPGKELGYIIVPVLINEEQDEEAVLNSSAFDQVWTVIKAMMSQDERLEEIISKVRRYQGEEALGGNRKKDLEELYVKLREKAEFIDLPKKFDVEEFNKHLYLKLVDINGKNWDYMFGQLVEWRRKNPYRWPKIVEKSELKPPALLAQGSLQEKILCTWCFNRRTDYKVGRLGKKEIKELENIGFQWYPYEEQWHEMFNTLKKFRNEHFDKWPSFHSKKPGERLLARWCGTQRRNNKKGILEDDKKILLEKLKFPFNVIDQKWHEMLGQLIDFRKNNPHSWPIMTSKNHNEKNLGEWCSRQREALKKKTLSQNKIKKLKKLRFPWNMFNNQWNEMLEQLILFKKENPHKWPDNNSKIQKEKKLGDWCVHQRMYYKAGQLKKEQITQLEKLGLNWNPFDTLWNKMFRKLIDFKKKNPNKWPSSNSTNQEEKSLGLWCNNRKTNYKQGRLSKEKIKKLEEIGFQWKIK